MKMLLPAFLIFAALAAGSAMAQADPELLRVRNEIVQKRYSSDLKAATPGQRANVVSKYNEQINPNRLTPQDYSKLPPEQRYKYGTGAMSTATQPAQGSSSYATSRKKVQATNPGEPTLNYYDLPGSATTGSDTLLPPR